MPVNGPASVEFNAVTKRYGVVTAVDAVSFRIEPGTLVTLLGPSGCGKTTTLRLIAGLEMATHGQILIGDRDVTRLSAAERNVCMVFQSYALFPHMSVLDNVTYGPRVSGLSKARARELGMGKIALLGLTGLEDRMPSELSGGQQQRVAVARALVLEPAVLLFDEPLSNLDAKLRRRVRDEIRELQQRLRLTVAYVTHDQEEALAVSDKVIVMSAAKIAQHGTPRDLYERPVDSFVADFIGDANIIPVDVVEMDRTWATVLVAGRKVRVQVANAQVGPARLVVRPEAVLLSGTTDTAALRGRLKRAAYVGSHVEYLVETAWGELFAIARDVASLLPVGEEVGITFSDRGAILLAR